VHYDGENWKTVGEKVKYANGVGVKNNRLYITGTQEEVVISYSIGTDGILSDKREIPSLFGNDNITFYEDKLITTNHFDFVKFLKHAKDGEKPSPSAAYSINLKTEKIDTLYLDNGEILGAASTALIYENNLYISQVFNPFIIEVPLSK